MKQERQIILGIDPGTRVTGYGVIAIEGGRHVPLDFGAIRPPQHLPIEQRYLFIFNGVEFLIGKYEPCAVSVETQFVQKNVQSAMKLGMARGAVMLAAARKGIAVFEYAPKKAKLAVVGNGSASKQQVQHMIQLLLGLSKLPEPEDAADALSLALCHAHTLNSASCLNTSKGLSSTPRR
jgi:crossover junction endodeoxyribonuclease RuvC